MRTSDLRAAPNGASIRAAIGGVSHPPRDLTVQLEIRRQGGWRDAWHGRAMYIAA
jgi:hypothetical protein